MSSTLPKKSTANVELVVAALPQKSTYFDAMRTNAYLMGPDHIEFWVAMQVDPKQDKWRIVNCTMLNMGNPGGVWRTENLCKDGDLSFPQAVYEIAKLEESSGKKGLHREVVDMTKQYPADKFPVVRENYHDVEWYRDAAHVEGIVFDKAGVPHLRVQGKIFTDGTFEEKEVEKSILAIEQARQHPKVAAKIEGGILSDIFNAASARNASLDNILKVGKTLECLDTLVTQVGAFYLHVQTSLGQEAKFNGLKGLTSEEKKDLFDRASVQAQSGLGILALASGQLDKADDLGVHTEPFRKFIAECSLYANLLQASQSVQKLEQGLSSVGGADPALIVEIRKSVETAQKKFVQLGGSDAQVDRLKAWVADSEKNSIPQWLPGFIERYYEQRRNVMKKVQEKRAGAREVNTMPAKVKPPKV